MHSVSNIECTLASSELHSCSSSMHSAVSYEAIISKKKRQPWIQFDAQSVTASQSRECELKNATYRLDEVTRIEN